LSEEHQPQGKKLPVAWIGAGVAAVAVAGAAVFVLTSSPAKPPAASSAEPVATEPRDDQTAQVQFGANGQTTPPTPPATPDPGAPVAQADGSLAFSDDTISFSAAIPPGSANDPVLTYLRTDALSFFEGYRSNARIDAQDRKTQGAPAMPWEVTIEWKYTASAGDIVSLVGTAYEFTGGAHGMTYTDTHIARAATGEEIAFGSMLQTGALSPAVTIAVCEALKRAKLESIGSATIYDEPIVCAGVNTNIKIEEAKFALAPSSEPNKFGGLFVYYDAYAVGPYAEGGHALTIPAEVFVHDVRPEYKDLFGGKVSGEPT
jgi:Deacetylase PdaC